MLYCAHVNVKCNSIYFHTETHGFAYAVLRNLKMLKDTAWTSFLENGKQAEK
jgi:hypothetical protein